MPSGAMSWGLDAEEEIFGAYGIPYQPWTVLVLNGVEVTRWPGALSEAEIRAEIEGLISLVG